MRKERISGMFLTPCAIHSEEMTHDAEPNQICILWHAEDVVPGEPLIRALSKRGLSVMPTASLHTAFAVACRCAKTAKRVVIVLDDRESLVGVDRLLDALDRFAPSVICWEHRPNANPPMLPVVRETPSIPSKPEPRPAAERTTAGANTDAKLRLVCEEESGTQSPTVSLPDSFSQKGPISSRDVLDADELDALLAGEFGQDRGRK